MDSDFLELDEIKNDLELTSEKLKVILQDIVEDYFEKYATGKRTDFKRNKIKADIAIDYMYTTNQGVEALKKVTKKLIDRDENSKAFE